MIAHEKQQTLQGAIEVVRRREEGELLTADQFARLTPIGRRDYLAQLSSQAFWDQAVIVGERAEKSPLKVIAEWAAEVVS